MPKPTGEDVLDNDAKKKKARFEAARQAALKEAATQDIKNAATANQQSLREHPRGLTVFPDGDKELEMINAEETEKNKDKNMETKTHQSMVYFEESNAIDNI